MQRKPETLGELVQWAESEARLAPLLARARLQPDEDAAHDFSHLLRVALWTIRLGGEEVDPREALAAALLHDLVNVPKDHPDRAKASEFSATEATPLLRDLGFEEESVARITGAILTHSFSRGQTPTSALGRALQDADRLEALGAIGVMRVFSTGARMGTRYFDPADPWATRRYLDDKKFSVDHFFTKLLKLPSTFHTAAGRAEATSRAQWMKDFLDQTALELGVNRP